MQDSAIVLGEIDRFQFQKKDFLVCGSETPVERDLWSKNIKGYVSSKSDPQVTSYVVPFPNILGRSLDRTGELLLLNSQYSRYS